MQSFSIKFKLIMLSVLAGVGMLSMAAIQISSTRSLESLGDARLLVSEIESDMLMLRRNEKDFLARKDLKYREKFVNNSRRIHEGINNLQSTLEKNGIDTILSVELQGVTEEYVQKFLNVITFQTRIGLHSKDGLYGSLRKAVHEAEEIINAQNDDRLTKDMLMLRRREKDFMLRMDLKYLEKFDKDVIAFHADLASSNHLDGIKQEIKEAMEQYKQDFHRLVDTEQEKGLNSKLGELGAMRSKIHESEDILVALSDVAEQKITQSINKQHVFSIVLAVLITLLIVAAITFIAIGIIRPIEYLSKKMAYACKEHDLTVRANLKGSDEISTAAQIFDRMMGEFETLMNKVLGSSVQLSLAAEKLTLVTQAGKDSAARQDVETEQVATAMNEMTATVQEVASSANFAADLSSKADHEVIVSKKIVDENMNSIRALAHEVQNSTDTISVLSEESENIGAVLNVIKGIAEQTNLLALNAAIEAARAGEQGRGFAVVADEVRSLAQRSQQSTHEIQEIVERLQQSSERAVSAMEDGQNKAQESVEKAKLVGESLDNISKAVSSINNMNIQIASTAEEQSVVSEEVNRNVENINQIANETADNTSNVNMTSESLAGLSNELHRLVAHFKLG